VQRSAESSPDLGPNAEASYAPCGACQGPALPRTTPRSTSEKSFWQSHGTPKIRCDLLEINGRGAQDSGKHRSSPGYTMHAIALLTA
jgi:hypothetical protein